ncbi:MAG: hypothetical protein KC422_02745 [Trueperaceae bacterium]|nr:hypothetical protein [Trueperaceae bacterium]
MKVLLDTHPLQPSNAAPADFGAAFRTRPAWLAAPKASLPEVSAYRLRFDLANDSLIRLHLSADERYLFYVDGTLLGRGPERGSDQIWFYETYDLSLTAGSHTFVALVWQLGDIAPLAQEGLAGGFLLEAEGPHGDLLSTRSAPWERKSVHGMRFEKPKSVERTAWFVEPIQTTIGADYPWGFEKGEGEGWEGVSLRREDFAFPFGIYAAHVLSPAILPAQLSTRRRAGRVRYLSAEAWDDPQFIKVPKDADLPEEALSWQDLLDSAAPIVIPPHSQRQLVLDLEAYVCAYPQVELSGGSGSRITIGWAEALHLDAAGKAKGHRDEVAGRTLIALCRDVIVPDGGANRHYEPLWWRSGRFIALLIETADEALSLERFSLLETRYPLEMESRFTSSDARLAAITPIALRGLQMCAHETYMDCPYYEQLMYVGDTRLESLVTYAISSDDRLPRKSILLFGLSRLANGFTQARYPSRDVQVIPPFALWWVGMVYDYALWRGDAAFIRQQLPGVRAVLDGFLAHITEENLLQAAHGWNFADWTLEWPLGVPPDGFDGYSGLLNWHLIYTLGLAVRLEEWVGESVLAERWRHWRDTLVTAVKAAFWNEARGLFADDRAQTLFSEHSQCLALLSGTLAEEDVARLAPTLLNDASLTQTTIYFSHYLFETYYLLQQPEAFFDRMALWFDLENQGFKTTPEQPEPSRSDCHGWGAHPLYHFFTTLLGIRPAGFGFEQVEISPMPGHLTQLSGEMVHPRGQIVVDLEFVGDLVRGTITLPAGVSGSFKYAGKSLALHAGSQVLEL